MKDRSVSGLTPEPRSFHAAALLNSTSMAVVGGRGEDSQHYNDCYLLDLGEPWCMGVLLLTKQSNTGINKFHFYDN